jgi:hypothetical protein
VDAGLELELTMTVGSGMPARGRDGRQLSPGFTERIWRKGQSGNPAGHSGLYGEVTHLAREASPRAIERLKELMESDDHRVAAVACNSIIDRAFGKPREYDPAEEAPRAVVDWSKASAEDRAALRALLLKVVAASREP